jgi:hypothetical protein
MCTHAAPTLRLEIEAEWGTTDKSPWDNSPSYRFTLQQETSSGWTSLETAEGFDNIAEAAKAAADALRLFTTSYGPEEARTKEKSS